MEHLAGAGRPMGGVLDVLYSSIYAFHGRALRRLPGWGSGANSVQLFLW